MKNMKTFMNNMEEKLGKAAVELSEKPESMCTLILLGEDEMPEEMIQAELKKFQ